MCLICAAHVLDMCSMKFVLQLQLFTISMVGVAYFLCVFNMANLNLKLCSMDING